MDAVAGRGSGVHWSDLEGSDDGEEVFLDDFLPPIEVSSLFRNLSQQRQTTFIGIFDQRFGILNEKYLVIYSNPS